MLCTEKICIAVLVEALFVCFFQAGLVKHTHTHMQIEQNKQNKESKIFSVGFQFEEHTSKIKKNQSKNRHAWTIMCTWCIQRVCKQAFNSAVYIQGGYGGSICRCMENALQPFF